MTRPLNEHHGHAYAPGFGPSQEPRSSWTVLSDLWALLEPFSMIFLPAFCTFALFVVLRLYLHKRAMRRQSRALSAEMDARQLSVKAVDWEQGIYEAQR